MSATPPERLLVSTCTVHDLRDDGVLVELACEPLPAIANFELLIFHGGNIVASSFAWRVRGTHKLVRMARVASA